MRKIRRAWSGRRYGRSAAKERFWRRHIARQSAGHLSVRVYCARHAVSEPSFYSWRRELARRDQAAARRTSHDQVAKRTRRPTVEFVRLNVRPDAEPNPIEIVLGDEGLRGTVLRIPRGTDQATLANVLAALVAARTQSC